MKKQWLLLTLALVLALVGCNKNDPSSIKLESEDDKTFYAMGFMLGGNLQRLSLSDKELQALYKGISVASKNEKSEVDMAKYQNRIQEVFKARRIRLLRKKKNRVISSSMILLKKKLQLRLPQDLLIKS
jgi:hypothetical protein